MIPAVLRKFVNSREKLIRSKGSLSSSELVMNNKSRINEIIQASRGNPKVITEDSAKEILSLYSINVPPFALVTSSNDAIRKTREIGFPLVAKIVSPDILHKTDVGGVKVGLNSEQEVKDAFEEMYFRLKEKYDVTGVLLEKMVPHGVEIIVGLQNDSQFGPCIMVGLGGIYTELFKDVSFRVLPINKIDALEMLESLKGKSILKGFRGSKPIDLEMLATAIVNIGTLGTDMAGKYESVDFNPVVVYPNNYYVVDAKIILRTLSSDGSISQSVPDSSYMDLFFNADSVALIGASPEVGKIGNSVLESLSKHQYKGKVYPVNAKGYPEILGLKAYKSLSDITEPVDVVVVTVDLRFVPDLLKECGRKNIHNMVVISGGGKELGGERAEIEKQVQTLSRELKVRIIGPNCIGIFNAENGLDCAFQGHARMLRPRRGNVAFLSQSGTIGIAFMETSDAFGLSKMISYGNRSDVDEADMIQYLAEDPKTDVIGLYVEGLGDGRKFINTARRVIKDYKKPIVVFKNGRSVRGAKQARFPYWIFGRVVCCNQWCL